MDKNRLLSYQPNYYANSKVIEQINNANINELTLLSNKIQLIKKNCDPKTADADTLSRYEKILNIKPIESENIEYRRIRVVSRFVGMGNFSSQVIKDIAKYYSGADVKPSFDIPNFNILIELISNVGLPNSLKYFEEIIEEIKPATFEVDYKLTSKTKDIINVNTFTLSGETIQVYPYQITSIESKGKLKIALGNTQNAEIISVNPL